MARLTYKDGYGRWAIMIDGRQYICKVAEKLAEYENMGDPSELQRIKRGSMSSMNGFIDKAVSAIMDHAKQVSSATKTAYAKTIYLLGAEHACDVLKTIAGNDVVKVIRCRDCKRFDSEKHVCRYWFSGDEYDENGFCSFAERK